MGEVTPIDGHQNGIVTSAPSDKPVLRLSQSELRRFYTFAERKQQLEQQIIAAQLVLTDSAGELKDVNAKFTAIQQEVATRFGITGPYNVTPQGIIDIPEAS